MTISSEDYEKLKASGFTEYEIQELASARTPDGKDQPPIDLNAASWQRALESRVRWINTRVQNGWSLERINEEILSYYQRDKRRSPFDFLKAEYRPPKRVDYWNIVRAVKQRSIRNQVEGYFK